jgi:hypothetical protein
MAIPDKPQEVPYQPEKPETYPPVEPEPEVWPKKEPEIKPGKEPVPSLPSEEILVPRKSWHYQPQVS